MGDLDSRACPKLSSLIQCHVLRELATPPLDGTILPGVTRDSILQLTAAWGEFAVTERHVTIREAKAVRGQVLRCKLASAVEQTSAWHLILLFACGMKLTSDMEAEHDLQSIVTWCCPSPCSISDSVR